MNENITQKIIRLAKKNKKKIVLPESSDIRVLKASEIIKKNNICEIILIGDEKEIKLCCDENNIDISGVKIINRSLNL